MLDWPVVLVTDRHQYAGGLRAHDLSIRIGKTQRAEAALDAVNPLVFGGEHPKLDKLERTVQYPIEKIKQWIPRREPAEDPQELRRLATFKAQEFLVLNELPDVHIDVREYDPATQWQRLKENDRIHPFGSTRQARSPI